jgi:hypothetical protein
MLRRFDLRATPEQLAEGEGGEGAEAKLASSGEIGTSAGAEDGDEEEGVGSLALGSSSRASNQSDMQVS